MNDRKIIGLSKAIGVALVCNNLSPIPLKILLYEPQFSTVRNDRCSYDQSSYVLVANGSRKQTDATTVYSRNSCYDGYDTQ